MTRHADSQPAQTCELASRALVEVRGPDSATFLGGLLSSDVTELADGAAAYAGLLSPQGKVMFDGLIYRQDDRYVLDVPEAVAPALAKRLGFYKLRAKVEIADLSPAITVRAFWGGEDNAAPAGAFADPRLPDLGFRALVPAGQTGAAAGNDTWEEADEQAYHRHRIGLGIPEARFDFTYDSAFPHDVAMDQLGGIDFKKGCYVGQEVVSRMEHRGTARRRVVQVTGASDLPPGGADITAGERTVGTLGSSDGALGIAIARLDRVAEARAAGTVLQAGDVAVELTLPAWARYDWPGGDGDD